MTIRPEPCPSCGGLLTDDGTDGWICTGCGDEWPADVIDMEDPQHPTNRRK